LAETRAPVFGELRTSAETVLRARKLLLGRVALAGLGVVRGVTAETVWAWLRRAAPQAAALHHHRRRHLPVTQGQRDEMWHGLARQRAREPDEAGASWPDGEEGRHGVGSSVAPALRRMRAAVVGPRPLDTAQEVVAATQARGAGSPAGFSDGFTGDRAALFAACHGVTTFARPGQRGRPRQPVWAPHPARV
jgi:hypothetical protein